jgi:hypothetical protein
MSFGNRIELMKAIRDRARQLEFHHAGEGLEDKVAAAVTNAEIDRLYLRWGLVSIDELTIDGVSADPDLLMERGPESLSREIVNEIRRECGLSEPERKN